MKLIRAVLRHSLLIAIVLGAGLAYYYRDELLPKFYEKLAEFRSAPEESEPAKTPTPEQAVEVKDEIVVTATDTDMTREPQPPAATSSPAAGAEAAAPAPVESHGPPAATPAAEQRPPAVIRPPAELSQYRPLDEESEENPQEAPVETQPLAAPAAAATPITTPSPTPGPAPEIPEGAGSAAMAPPGGSKPELPAAGRPPEEPPAEAQAPAPVGTAQPPSAPIAAPAPDTARRDELRIVARSAFWRHDYQQAEKNYQELIQLDPDDPDAYGELGNVYFSQGNWKAAGGAFYEAALRLIKSGQVDRARRLLTVIRGLDPERARELEQQLATNQGGTGN